MATEQARPVFSGFDLKGHRDSERLLTLEDRGGRSSLTVYGGRPLVVADGATHFGLVLHGILEVNCASGRFSLGEGMYCSIPGEARLSGPARAILFSRSDFEGFFCLGGPIERQGRLKYIDGCTDSVLIPPVCLGDPCLNLLHVPPLVHQSSHTHPSHRLGVVVSGRGTCRTASGDVDLEPQMAWVIQADGVHSFHTRQTDLRIVAYHPDSDFGPTHENHPMLNRTVLTPSLDV